MIYHQGQLGVRVASIAIMMALTISGCAVSKSRVSIMSPEEMVTKLKSECVVSSHPSSPERSITSEELIGEWYGSQIALTQLLDYPENLSRIEDEDTYQFFEDRTYTRIHNGALGVQAVDHGVWSVDNGILQLRCYANNALQRLPPMNIRLLEQGKILVYTEDLKSLLMWINSTERTA